MNIASFEEMEAKLVEWGRWVKDESIYRQMFYPQSDNLQRLRKRDYEALPPPDISDDDVVEIDKAVGRLKLIEPLQADIIWRT